MNEVSIAGVSICRVREALGEAQFELIQNEVDRARDLLRNRTIWNINSTARGGGVAEMLQPLVGYARGFGADVRWLVIDAPPRFFEVTKRLHNHIHEHPGDGGPLGRAERKIYETALRPEAEAIAARIRKDDVIICHDPQTAGLVSLLRDRVAGILWRSHIGHERPGELAQRAWAFLAPYLQEADRYVFSRRAFVPPGLDESRAVVVAPSIDPLSPKNQALTPEVVRAILVRTGIVAGPAGEAEPCYTREDGSLGRVERCADIVQLGQAPSFDRPLLVQVSRWDHLKDPIGVMTAFAPCAAMDRISLVLAGPNVTAVADDPEGGRVLDDVMAAWRRLPHEVRKHVHIACLPMADREENAAIVNALQRHATIVVQKSLYEGFGLTVTEAMWKSRPIIASAVGGIVDQIEDGVHGLLLGRPDDAEGFGRAVLKLLDDPILAQELALNARARVQEQYLFGRHLKQYLRILEELLDQDRSR